MIRTLRYVGVVLVLAGVVVGLSPTLGLTTVAADRGISVATADDGTALVALEATGATVDSTDGTRVATLRNNAGEPLSTTYQISTTTDDLTVETSDGQTTLSPDDELAISLACRPGNRQGTAQLQVTVPSADGATVSVENAILAVDVSYDCPAGNQGPPPGKGQAFNDKDNDGVYDPGETTYTADELRNYDNSSADLVINDAGTIDAGNRKVSITANTTTIVDSELRSKQSVTIESESGAATFRNATVDSRNNKVTVKAPTVSAEGSTVSSKNEVALTAESGPATVTGSTVSSSNNKVTVEGTEVSAAGASISGKNEIKVTGNSGPVDLAGANVDSRNNKVTLGGSSVSAAGASISGKNEIKLTGNSGPVDIDGASVTSANNKVTIEGASVSAVGTTVSSKNEIKLTSDARLDLTDSTITSANSKVTLTAEGGALDASGTTVEGKNTVSLTSNGDMTLTDATLTSRNGQASATLNLASATLAVEGLSISDTDDVLRYSPSEATVTGTPDEGSVAPG